MSARPARLAVCGPLAGAGDAPPFITPLGDRRPCHR